MTAGLPQKGMSMYKIGDKVKMYKQPWEKKVLGSQILTVVGVHNDSASQTGILIDAIVPACPHCGAKARKFIGYDSAWFKVAQKGKS